MYNEKAGGPGILLLLLRDRKGGSQMFQIEKRHGWGRVSSYLADLITSPAMLPTASLLNGYDK